MIRPVGGAGGAGEHAQEAFQPGCRRDEKRVEHRVLEGPADAATGHVVSPTCPGDDQPDPTDEEHDEQQTDNYCPSSWQMYTGHGSPVMCHSPSRRLTSNVSSWLTSSSTPSPTRVILTVTRVASPSTLECR